MSSDNKVMYIEALMIIQKKLINSSSKKEFDFFLQQIDDIKSNIKIIDPEYELLLKKEINNTACILGYSIPSITEEDIIPSRKREYRPIRRVSFPIDVDKFSDAKYISPDKKLVVYSDDKSIIETDTKDGKNNTYVSNLLFIVDATSSMSPYIANTLSNIKKLVPELSEKFRQNIRQLVNDDGDGVVNIVVRVALVVYRDFCDNVKNIILNFTTDIDYVFNFLSKIQAEGGGDEAEDMYSGYKYAVNLATDYKLDWNLDSVPAEKTTNIIYHYMDAPGHCPFMNDGHSDNHPEANNEEDWKMVINRLREMNCELIITKLVANRTDKTIDFLRSLYDDKEQKEDSFKMTVIDMFEVAGSYNPTETSRELSNAARTYSDSAYARNIKRNISVFKEKIME